MTGETLRESEDLDPRFVYTEVEGRGVVDLSEAPEASDDLQQEAVWHMTKLAYRIVSKADGTGWTRDEILDAITEGHADGFTVSRMQFPPIPFGEWLSTRYPMRFDDRNFGERVANRTLAGHGREPRDLVLT